ncbi:MAG: ATP-grasp domain-containing protein [Patescibacteria group bacterium]
MSKIRIGVIRGGKSDEFEISIKTGGNILKNLPADKYKGVDILITRDGEWHLGGVPKDPREIALHIDVAFNTLHGEHGEDGKVSQILEEMKIPYTGSEAVPSSIALNKPLTKEALRRAGIKVPPGMLIEDYRDEVGGGSRADKIHELALKIFRSIPPPWVLKPARGGSSINTFVAKSFEELQKVLDNLFDYGGDLVVEQYLRGKEVSSGVIENFRHERHYPLMPVEVKKKGDLFNFEEKQQPELICPSTLSRAEKDAVMDTAIKAHKVLGLRDYSVSDFIVLPKSIYLLEVNNNPKCAECSIMAESLKAVGSNIGDLADHLITLALERK